MKHYLDISFVTLLLVLPQQAAAELWLCKSETGAGVVFTNQPLGECQKHLPKAGSFSSVPQTYFDLLIEEHKDYFRQSPLGQLALEKGEDPKMRKDKPRAVKIKSENKKKVKKEEKLSQKASDKSWR